MSARKSARHRLQTACVGSCAPGYRHDRAPRPTATAAPRPAGSRQAARARSPVPPARRPNAVTARKRAASSATTATSSRSTGAIRRVTPSRSAPAVRAARRAVTAFASPAKRAMTATRAAATAALRPARARRAGQRSGGWLARGRRGVGGRRMRWPRFRCRWTRAGGCRAPERERPRRDVSRVGTAGGREHVQFWSWPTVVAADRHVGNNGAASRQSPSSATTSDRSASLARRLRTALAAITTTS